MKKIYVFLAIIIFISQLTINSSAQAPNTWTLKANFGGTARYVAVGFSIGAYGYIGTGYDNTIGAQRDFWEYDPSSNTWTQKADFGGTARMSAVGFSIGTKGYIGTGEDTTSNFVNDFWEYDPSANTWTQKANFGGTARMSAVGFSIGTKGYIGTGEDTTSNFVNDFWEYDPSANTWTQKANFGGTARMSAVGFNIGANGYIGTGFDATISYRNDFWEYDPSVDIWTQKANFGGSARAMAVGLSIGTQGYIGTGWDTISPYDCKDFWEYNPSSDTWTQKANFGGTARREAVGFSIGTQGYIGTGYDGSLKNDFWQYNPSCNFPSSPTNTTPPANQNICSGNSTILSASGTGTLGWYNASSGGTWLHDGTSYTTPILTTSTTYYVQDSTCGPSPTRTSIPVTVNPLPTPTIVGPTSVCATSTENVYTSQASMTNYIWSVSSGGTITAGGTSTNNTVTVTWNTAGSQTVSVNYTNANSCTALAPTVYSITVNPLPTPSIAGPTSVCATSTGNVYITQSGMTNYSWSVSSGGTITAGGTATSNTVTVTWNTAGSQTVTVNYTNANGCTALVPVVYNITVNPLPTPTITGPTSVCSTSTGNVYTTQAGMTNYIWSVSSGGMITAGGTATSNTVTVTWNTAGSQTVTVNYTNANGCTALVPVVYNITVNPLPIPTIAGPTSVCATSTGNVYTSQTGMINYIWSVSSGGTITAGGTLTSSSVTVTWNTAGSQTVTVNYTNANGCTALVPVVYNITVNPLPTPTIAGPTSVCATSTGNVYTSQTGMTNYIWSVSSGGTITAGGFSTSSSVTVTWNTTGSQSVSVNYTNANGCTALTPTVYNITVNPLPTPTITGPTSVCSTSTGNVYTTQAGMTNYIWSVSSGGMITAGGTATSNTVTVTWNTTGSQSVNVNYTNANGCTAPVATTYNVIVNPRPVPTITGPTPVCVGSTGNVYATQAGMSGYTWTISAGGTITTGTGTNVITVTWTTAGVQTVSVNYSNSSGCSALVPTMYPVTVNALPVPVITGPLSVCVGSTGNVYSTQTGMANYIWSISAGGTITAGGTTSDNTVTVTWNIGGSQTISVNYTNTNGCTAAIPTVNNVTVNSLPVPTITGQTSLCVNSGDYNYTTEAGMTNYVWTVSSGGIIDYGFNTNQIQVSWINAGPQTISVTYTSAAGCNPISPTLLDITVNPLPDPAGPIIGPANVCAGSNGVAYSVYPIPNTTTYVWAMPPNATIASGAGTNSITVDFAANASSGDIIVWGNNICGDGQNSPPFSVSVTQLPVPAGNITGPDTVCQGSTGKIYTVPSIYGATGYTWALPTGATAGGGSNSDSITVNFNNTAVSGDITVYGSNSCGRGIVSPNFPETVNPIPTTPTVTNVGDTLKSNIPTGNQWYFEGTFISGATGQTYDATQDGYYWDVLTIDGCPSDTSNHKLIIVTGIDSHYSASINVYPVPNDGRFNVSIIDGFNESFSISVYNTLGVKIYEEINLKVIGSLQVIDLRPLPNGVYTLIFENSQNKVVKKIVVNK
jgi:small neutral amino acid transporter SnatA (MarC family)